jgi:broad specificity phosphatase PhoE
MSVAIVYETHSTTLDNERGFATGWLPGELSPVGRENAADLGRRRRNYAIDAVFTSDLTRALETARIAFGDSGVPIIQDARLRECNYGDLNGAPSPLWPQAEPAASRWRSPAAKATARSSTAPGTSYETSLATGMASALC